MEEGAVIMAGLNENIILESLNFLIKNSDKLKESHKIIDDYNVPNVSNKILKIIYSYKDLVFAKHLEN